MGKNNIANWIKMMRKSNPKTSIVPSFDEADSGKVLAAGKEGEPTWADCESGGIPLEDGESIIVSKEN